MSDSSDNESFDQNEGEEEEVAPAEDNEKNDVIKDEEKTFKDLGIVDTLCDACESLKWKKPTKIQLEAIPVALKGGGIGVKATIIVGGMDMMSQALTFAKKPHILIATPGRLVDHLENTKGSNLKSLKFLVMDEADRILNMDFEIEVDTILKVIPRERRTFLVIPNSEENISFSKYLTNMFKLRFLDSYRFLPSSLNLLVQTIPQVPTINNMYINEDT